MWRVAATVIAALPAAGDLAPAADQLGAYQAGFLAVGLIMAPGAIVVVVPRRRRRRRDPRPGEDDARAGSPWSDGTVDRVGQKSSAQLGMMRWVLACSIGVDVAGVGDDASAVTPGGSGSRPGR